MKKVIYNCHTHIFTDKHIPSRYLPFFLVAIIKVPLFSFLLKGIMKIIVPFTKKDLPHRFVSFINAAYRKTQENNFKHLKQYYPGGTKFIVLPMDMGYMDAGRAKEDIDQQHRELAELASSEDYRDLIIPFAHIDPRNPGALERLKDLVENHNFQGVKIYPTLGYLPSDPVLMDQIYPYMIEKNIPLMAHCSPGAVNNKKMKKADAHKLADPENYIPVMEKYPRLKICLAHFGGIDEWERFIDQSVKDVRQTWLEKIVDMMKSGEYDNLYADISYTVFNFQDNVPLLKVLLEDARIAGKVLFGSDYYMVESKKYSEKRLSIDLRSALGEELFWKIANENPQKYLKG